MCLKNVMLFRSVVCCRSVLCVSTVRFVVCCRGVFAVGADTHIAGLETVKQNVLAGTSNWAAKVAITGTRPAHGLHAMTAQRGLLSRQYQLYLAVPLFL